LRERLCIILKEHNILLMKSWEHDKMYEIILKKKKRKKITCRERPAL